ncbi:MAG: T9SS type A sorting domain-containing protein [Bacteroidia bacterium]
MKKSLLFLFGSLVFAGSLSAQTIFLTEDFEGGSIPASWTATPATGGFAVGTNAAASSTYFAPSAHTKFAYVNDDAVQSASNGNTRLSTPVINLSTATSVVLKYDSYFLHGSNNNISEAADIMTSIDGGVTWTSAGIVTPGIWLANSIDLSTQLAGQANAAISFRYNDGGEWEYGFCIDNVVVMSPPPIGVALVDVTPVAYTQPSVGAVTSNITLGGTFTNLGGNHITTIAVKYTDGSSTFTQNINSINIGPYQSYTFTHPTPYTIPSVGGHPIKMWVELSGDPVNTDDTLSTVVNGAAFTPTHNVTFEEATGTWCGWCVRGIVYMDSIDEVYPNTTSVIAVHNSDPMANTIYDTGMGTLIAGYPSTVVNGNFVSDPQDAFTDYNNTINDFGMADITPTVTYNWNTRVASVNVSTHFAAELAGDFRLACVFTEDYVHGTTATFAQHNYYSYTSQNIPLYGQGVDYQAAPLDIPAVQMWYKFVARTILGGFNGMTGSLPAVIPVNSTQVYTFNYTVPITSNPNNMHVIVMLINNNNGDRIVMNSKEASSVVGANAVVNPTVSLGSVSVYPNPFNTTTTVEMSLVSSDNVTIEMFDMTGKLVSSENKGTLAAGQHLISLDGSNLADGMYFVKITAGTSVVTQKVSIAH